MADCIFPNGSTITFSTGYSAKIQQVGSLIPRSVAVADGTPIDQAASSYKLMKASKRMSHDPISIQFFVKPSLGLPELGVDDQITITFPDGGGTITGKGFIVSDSLGDMVSDELMVGTREFQFKGGTTAGDFPLYAA